MGITPQDLKKVLSTNPTDHGRPVGFVASHNWGKNWKRPTEYTSKQLQAMANGRKIK